MLLTVWGEGWEGSSQGWGSWRAAQNRFGVLNSKVPALCPKDGKRC